MLKSISFKKLAGLTAGIAIVLSSCGLQNTASESSGTETAAGKTKNAALASEWCYVTGQAVNIDAPWGGYPSIRWLADITRRAKKTSGNRFDWVGNDAISDVYGPSIVRCRTLVPVNVAAAAGATSAAELPQAFVENSTANQCITIENRKKTLREYDEQIMAHSLDTDKTTYEQMKTGRWVTTVQRPCDEPAEVNSLSALACVSVSHKAMEVAFYNEQYELRKDEAGTPYLDSMIIGKEKANSLITC
jgi:hypothetical protein